MNFRYLAYIVPLCLILILGCDKSSKSSKELSSLNNNIDNSKNHLRVSERIDSIFTYSFGNPEITGEISYYAKYKPNGLLFEEGYFEYYQSGELKSKTIYKIDSLKRKISAIITYGERFTNEGAFDPNMYDQVNYLYPNDSTRFENYVRHDKIRGINYVRFNTYYSLNNKGMIVKELKYSYYLIKYLMLYKTYNYDSLGYNLTEEKSFEYDGSLNSKKNYLYDKSNHLIETQELYTDQTNNIYSYYFYSPNGLLLEIKVKNYINELLYLIKSSYNFY
ncbi:MAG: hypothetical protein ACYDA4_16675 [Ignavibacteriaceae bacterium]